MHFKNWFFSRFLLVFYLAFWVKIFMLEIIKTVLFLSVYVFLDWLWLDHFIRTSFCTQNFTLHNQGNKKAKCWGIWCHSRERYLVSRSHLMKGNDGFSVRSTHETQRLLYLTLGHKLPYSIYITIWTILTVTQVLKKSGFHPKYHKEPIANSQTSWHFYHGPFFQFHQKEECSTSYVWPTSWK